MFWKRPSIEAPAILSVPPSPAEHQRAAETVSSLLEVCGQLPLPYLGQQTEHSPEYEAWAHKVRRSVGSLLRLDSDEPANSTPKMDWASLVRFFSQQREAEVLHVSATSTQLSEAVQVFSRTFQELLCEAQHSDTVAAEELTDLATQLTNVAESEVVVIAQGLIDLVRSTLAQRRTQWERRRSVLCRQLATAQHDLEEQAHSKPGVDPWTRLHDSEAWMHHLGFLCVVAGLVESPPILLLLRLEPRVEGIDEEAWQAALGVAADELIRVFYAREEFAARAGESSLGVAIPSATVHDTQDKVGRLFTTLREQQSLENFDVGVSLTTLVAGEAPEVWWERAHQCLGEAVRRNTCQITEVPAEFV